MPDSYEKTVRPSLAEYIHSNAGFIDCLIHQINKKPRLVTFTFDQKADRLENMQVITRLAVE